MDCLVLQAHPTNILFDSVTTLHVQTIRNRDVNASLNILEVMNYKLARVEKPVYFQKSLKKLVACQQPSGEIRVQCEIQAFLNASIKIV